MTLRYERLSVPSESPGLLIEPSPEVLLRSVSSAHGLWQVRILGRPIAEWRAGLQRRFGLRAPLIVTGHQAEFFHAGVFAKNIAANVLAERLGGAAGFMVVDSDTPKSSFLAIPVAGEGRLTRRRVDLPASDPRVPVEFQRAATSDWRRLFDEMRRAATVAADTCLDRFAQDWLGGAPSAQGDLSLADGIAAAIPAMERALELPGALPLRVSELCETPAFRAFAAHVLLNARAFAQQYNKAQAAYRQRHRVRNRLRPVPPLAVEDAAVEAPFWLVRAGTDTRRQRMFVRAAGAAIEVSADRETIATVSAAELGDADRHERAWPLRAAGWHIRPRALALSCFARLMVCDLFIHGIGGAKYDEVTDDFAQAFFGAALPAYACVTATLHLPFAPDAFAFTPRREIERRRRDVRWNPQRHLQSLPPVLRDQKAAAIERGRQLARTERAGGAARRAAHQDIARINAEMLRAAAPERERLERQFLQLEEQAGSAEIARDREAFFALHPRTALLDLADMLRARIAV